MRLSFSACESERKECEGRATCLQRQGSEERESEKQDSESTGIMCTFCLRELASRSSGASMILLSRCSQSVGSSCLFLHRETRTKAGGKRREIKEKDQGHRHMAFSLPPSSSSSLACLRVSLPFDLLLFIQRFSVDVARHWFPSSSHILQDERPSSLLKPSFSILLFTCLPATLLPLSLRVSLSLCMCLRIRF